MSSTDFHVQRQRMVREQILARGIDDPRVLQALNRVPRERFVPPEQIDEAYADRALPIACDQTISQPYIVALMSAALEISGGERTLEIGTGSGYQTAVLVEMGADVCSIERHAELYQRAAALLTELNYPVKLIWGDGTRGWPEEAPFDRIVVTAGAPVVPEALLQQLVDGGVMVMPVGHLHEQQLYQIRRDGERFTWNGLSPCRFVPLVSGG